MREGVGLPASLVAIMPLMPAWSKLKAVAHTLPYDTRLTIDQQQGDQAALDRWSTVRTPTLVAAGGKSPAWMRHAMETLAQALPHALPQALLHARHQTLPGQTHIVKPAALAPVWAQFFSAETWSSLGNARGAES
ncbi:alpha/beta fold hydrolase [Cohnella sp. 56]|uniref:alpha/beta fold hydrolase n=1 Tax=Cohnella sp. 56 TaxID=3113722 RepID=UPI0030E9FEA1